MLVDLHAHYPMHVLPAPRRVTHTQLRRWRRAWFRTWIVRTLSLFLNYQAPGDQPGVTVELMRQGDVGVIFSALYCPFDEIDLEQRYGAKPQTGYFEDVLEQLDDVEVDIASHEKAGFPVTIPRSCRELDEAINAKKHVLIHSVEGGFHVGATEQEVRANVQQLAQRGVVCITVAHLFWRHVATNAPALPFMRDKCYRRVFHQPGEGLTPLGRTLVTAMADNNIVIDLAHMSEPAMRDTLDLLDQHAPKLPVMATHVACRLGKLEYNLTDGWIERIANRDGVIGLIACEHYISDGHEKPESFRDSFERLCDHIERIRRVTGKDDHVAFGTDLDGYIKPALPGLEHLGRMHALQQALVKEYGAATAAMFASENALRVIRAVWR